MHRGQPIGLLVGGVTQAAREEFGGAADVPAGVVEHVGRVQVQPQDRGVQIRGPIRQLNGPPRRLERRFGLHPDAVGPGRQIGLEDPVPALVETARNLEGAGALKTKPVEQIDPALVVNHDPRATERCKAVFPLLVFLLVPALECGPTLGRWP